MPGVLPFVIASRIFMPEASAASFRLEAVAKALVEAGSQVRVLTTRVPGKEVSDPEGVIVSRWPVKRDSTGYVRGYIPYMSFDIPLFFRVLCGKKASALLVEPPPTTGVMVRLAAGIRRAPYVWYAADVWSDASEIAGAPAAVVKAVRWMESFTIKGAAGVVAVSDGVAERVRALEGTNIEVIPNGIDVSTFTPDGEGLTEAEKAQQRLGEEYFLYAGTASEWQGAEVFAHAIAEVRKEHPNAQVVYLGQGSSWDDIAAAAQSITTGNPDFPAVVQHPLVPADEAARWQRSARGALVSIRPGIGYDFAYPTKVLAALASGTPVLYAGVGPVADDVTANDLGECCDHEPQAVAHAMKRLLDREQTPALAKRLHQWVVDNRSMTTTGQHVARLLQQIAR